MRKPQSADQPIASTSNFDVKALRGRLVHGTCGWAAKSQILSFYTKDEASTGERRLPRYAERFGCVEVDSTTYAIPQREIVQKWVDATPEGFSFIVKAFGAFCASSVDARNLPRDVREMCGTPSGRVRYASMQPRAKDALWERFNVALAPIIDAGKLGCVVFQFHLSQPPSESLRAHVLDCQARLSGARVAVEFRNRDWITGSIGDETVCWAKENDLLLVAADELEHETFQRDREQSGLPPGAIRRRMFTRLERTVDWGSLIRVHRRYGTKERVLDDGEIGFWVEQLARFDAPQNGPVWVAWGTEWLDAPLTNANALDKAAGDAWSFDWYGTRSSRVRPKSSAAQSSSNARLFAAAPPRSKNDAARVIASTEKRVKPKTLSACWARADAMEANPSP